MHFHVRFEPLRKLVLFVGHLYTSFDEQHIVDFEGGRIDQPIFEITHALVAGIERILLQASELRRHAKPLRAEIAFELLDLR